MDLMGKDLRAAIFNDALGFITNLVFHENQVAFFVSNMFFFFNEVTRSVTKKR